MKLIRKLSGRKASSDLFGPTITALFFVLILAFVPSVIADTFTCGSGEVDCLIDAIILANANDEEDTIELEKGDYEPTGAVAGSYGFPPITSAITIKGASPTKTVIKRSSHADFFGIFSVASGQGLF